MIRHLARCTAALLLTTLMACGPTAPLGDLSVVGPDAIVLVPGGTAVLTFKLERPPARPVSLSAIGLPEGVTATFSPATLEEPLDTATLTLTATREAVRGPALVQVEAVRAEDQATTGSTFALEVRGLTVRGTVGARGRDPGRGIFARIGDEVATVGTSGDFTFTDVSVPYDLSLEQDWELAVFLGLSTPTPVLELGWFSAQEMHQASVNVALPEPLQGGERLIVCIDGPRAAGCSSMGAPLQDTYLTARWDGANTLEGTLRGYITAAQPDGTVALTASIATPVTLTRLTSARIELERGPPPATLEVPIALGATLPLDRVQFTAIIPLADEVWNAITGAPLYDVLSTSTTLTIPQGTPGGIITASVESYDTPEVEAFAWAPFTAGEGLSFDVIDPPTVTGPEEGATLGTDDTFTAEFPGEAVRRHAFRLADGRDVAVHTPAATIHFPDLSSIWPEVGPEDVEEWEVSVFPGDAAYERLLDGEPVFSISTSTRTLGTPVLPTRAGQRFTFPRVWFTASP